MFELPKVRVTGVQITEGLSDQVFELQRVRVTVGLSYRGSEQSEGWSYRGFELPSARVSECLPELPRV